MNIWLVFPYITLLLAGTTWNERNKEALERKEIENSYHKPFHLAKKGQYDEEPFSVMRGDFVVNSLFMPTAEMNQSPSVHRFTAQVQDLKN
jgi:hypothetical protein